MADHRDASAASGNNASNDRPGEKRTTSSARQPRTGLPLRERVLPKRNARNARAGVEPARTKVWRAQLASFSSCERANYDGEKGLVNEFEFTDSRPRNSWCSEVRWQFASVGDDFGFF